ncbi:hypothetical protein [Neobacillus niacini]|uniref:hypothetical protein n=1 Tax=Neobacillus niacini TaxID=86668 RepID=UPI0007AB8075|nr:hypothetical protein [Neobacillus niacini]
MYKCDKSIDSETFKIIEQEIYERTINYSNKYEVILKLNELKSLSENELRAKMPWELINKHIGYKQIVFSWIKDIFLGIKGIINRNKYVVNNDSLEFLKPNSEKAYNLTYKYYVKSIFDSINNDIKGILDKHEINYVYLYPHEVSLEKPEASPDIYNSEETKKWDRKEEIVDLFQVAIWIITIGWFYKVVIDYDFNLLGKIILLLSGVSIPTLYKLIKYYVKVRKTISGYKDRIVIETKNLINSDLQPETATNYILDEFFERVVKKIKEKKPINHKYLKIVSTMLSVSLVIVVISHSLINNQDAIAVNLNQPKSGTLINESHAPKKDVEKYLQTKGILPLLSNEPMPEEEIKFVKEKITGKVSSVTMNLSLDCSSIKVKNIDEKGNIHIEATIKLKNNANGWEIIKGNLLDINENKTLKEKYKDRLDDKIQEIYQSKKSVIDTFDKIKKRAKIEAKGKIDDLVKNQYPDINEIEEITINYQTDGFDMSGTDLK